MTKLIEDLLWRGLVAESTDLAALGAAMEAGPITFYVGFDPTGPSLHHGHLVQVITARRLQQAGHRPIALVGGSTGLVGDPNPDSERTLNPPDVVAAWTDRIRAQVEPFLDFSGRNAARLVNNLEWTAPMSAIEFLREIGRHFRVNRMIAKEAVAARLASDIGISYTEFSYQILQALDYLELYRRYECRLQTGGSDQWGNITSGVDLIRRADGQVVHAMATPLLTRADGTKFGKTSVGGALWLDPERTSPYAFYQFWLNSTDADIGAYLRVLSFRSREEIEALEAVTADRPAERAGQRALAEELTALVHGAEETARVMAASRALFGHGDLADLDERTLAAALNEVPQAVVTAKDWPPLMVDLLADSGLAPSRSAARRTLAEGGAYVNNRKIDAADASLQMPDLLHGRWAVLRRGRRTIAGVRVDGPVP